MLGVQFHRKEREKKKEGMKEGTEGEKRKGKRNISAPV
jgi:DNA invertase Pin-like site-specific DNA recombinase